MDSENVNIHNEDFRHGSEIPTSIKRECDYFIKYLHPRGFKFRDVYNNCSNSNQLGLKSGGIRRRTGRYIENTLRNKAYASSFRLPHQVSSSEAPQASSALNRLKEIYPHRFQDQATMPSSHDYNDHGDEDDDDDDDDFAPPAVPRRPKSTPKARTSFPSDAGLAAMLGTMTVSPRGSARRNSRGPVHAEAPHDSHDLYSTVAKLANIYALDPDNQVTHPPSVQAFYVDGCEVKDANTKIDKLVVAMQVANPAGIEYVTGELSNDQKSILVKAPDICPWIVDNQETIATRLAKELNPTKNTQAEASAFISSIAARHSGAPSHLSSQDSITDVAMKTTTLLLPPHLTGSNQFFNDGRWRWCVRDHLSLSHSY